MIESTVTSDEPVLLRLIATILSPTSTGNLSPLGTAWAVYFGFLRLEHKGVNCQPTWTSSSFFSVQFCKISRNNFPWIVNSTFSEHFRRTDRLPAIIWDSPLFQWNSVKITMTCDFDEINIIDFSRKQINRFRIFHRHLQNHTINGILWIWNGANAC